MRKEYDKSILGVLLHRGSTPEKIILAVIFFNLTQSSTSSRIGFNQRK